MAAVGLDVAAAVLIGVLSATTAAQYGSLGVSSTANLLLLELVGLIAMVFLVTLMRGGADWARSVLVLVGLTLALFFVLRAGPEFAGALSAVAILRSGVAVVRVLEAAVIIGAAVMMFGRDARLGSTSRRSERAPRTAGTDEGLLTLCCRPQRG